MTTQLRLPEQNQVLLSGRLTRDPDVRFTQKGQTVCQFDIAVNRRFLDQASGEWKDDVTYVTIVVWGQPAERCKDRVRKGTPVYVEGRLSLNQYTAKDGQVKRNLQVVSRRVQILQYSTDGETVAPLPQQNVQGVQNTQGGGGEQIPTVDVDAVSDNSEDDVPF
ncbi:MAG: single-stranded DNA-binding protein [Elusimicrobiaceae bacterium]|jgi:single-strand DNA-binding protein|nr:single-stranded DNA-binding protein [Elusimicrobiaceae bacterium]MBT3955336.1 single-stranded DNA-binding protein [Elusimicrobiaceae bacterium]MBT4008472.1 single-stranded DNA-binding protein [Elusimicrobiaceae bacterium]MBT4403360.1 single-stranded DNA-binding protein [Elusimicrobiaceae bacterium]MBT4440201.1 single-stranded DNA-binding protein [Elusimicrobiaceae bacterium]